MKTLVLTASLAAILAGSMVMTPAFASWASVNDASDYDANNNFDIREVGITSDGNLRLTVDGTVGATKPDGAGQGNLVYAYVFATDLAGFVAVTSHAVEDSGQVANDLEWHTHFVTLDDNFCVTSITDFGKAKLQGSRLDVLQTGATSVAGALTAQLTVTPDDPDTEEVNEFSVCVSEVFDLAPNNLLG